MKLKYFTLLSVGTIFVLSACQERGKIIPPSSKKHIKKKTQQFYDFPVLKLSANVANTPLPNRDKKDFTTIKKENNTAKEISYNLRFPKMSKDINLSIQKEIKNSAVVKQPILVQKSKLKPSIKSLNHKRKVDTSKVSTQIPFFSAIFKPNISLQDIPILNKILPKPSKVSKSRIKKRHPRIAPSNVYKNNMILPTSTNNMTPRSFSGGTSSTGLDMAKIRIETDNYQTNIILDSYKWVGYNAIPSEPSSVSGIYFFKYEPQNNRIVANVQGYNTFSALLKKQNELWEDNPMIKSIYIDRYIGDNGIKFIIELKKKLNVNIIDLENPGSIIIELHPLKSK